MNESCGVDGCPRAAEHRGWCSMHYNRWLTQGDLGPAEPMVGALHHNWAGDSVSYGGAHSRVRAARGRAAEYACNTCGQPAEHWAYDHTDPNEKMENGKPYSPDVERYRPLCSSCHIKADRKRPWATPAEKGPHNSLKTHCPLGHPYDEANTGYTKSTGHRYCRECNRLKARANYQRKKEAKQT